MGSEDEQQVDECPVCGRTDFSGEYGIGFHLTRYCENASEADREFGRSLMSGENHPMTGREMPEEAKEAISEASSGREMPEEAKQKISESLQGHEVSDETRQKISESLQGENNPWYGVTGKDHPYGTTSGAKNNDNNYRRLLLARTLRGTVSPERIIRGTA